MSESENTEAVRLVQATSRFVRVAGHLPELRFSTVAWRTLAALERGGGARVSGIAKQQRITQPSATSLVNRLAGEGWVERTPDPADGRASLVTITAAGSRALADYRGDVAARLEPLIRSLSDADRAALAAATGIIDRLAASLEAP